MSTTATTSSTSEYVYHFNQGQHVDSEFMSIIAAIPSHLSTVQLVGILDLIVSFVKQPSSLETFSESVGEVASDLGISISSSKLKTFLKVLVLFVKGSSENGLNSLQVKEDLLNLGISKEAVDAEGKNYLDVISQLWNSQYSNMILGLVGKSIKANQLIDMKWKFGVTSSSSAIQQVGATFLQMKFVIEKGKNGTEEFHVELTLPQFYNFLTQMEKAKNYIDYLSS